MNLGKVALVVLALLLLLGPHRAAGQESPITVSLNRTTLTTDDLLILTVTVVDDSAEQPRPILDHLDGLVVVDLDISTQMSVIQGKIQTEVTYTYSLQPHRTGKLTLPPVRAKVDGKIFEGPPLTIEVKPGAPPSPSPDNAIDPLEITPPSALAGEDIFIEGTVDFATPYIGQQLIYTFRLYQAIQLYRRPEYELPLFTGFEPIALPIREYNLEFSGRNYLVTELRTALFAHNVGQTAIRPAHFILPGTAYEEAVELSTAPITVVVKSLPATPPINFGGAVGEFQIKASFSPQVAMVGQPSTLYVVVKGQGNLHTLPEPIWPELHGWRVYDSLTSLSTTMNPDGMMTGTRVFERLVVPNRAGDYTIGPISLVYFDPVAVKYHTISTPSLPVKVLPLPTPAPLPPAVVPAPPATVQEAEEGSLSLVLAMSLFVGLCALLPGAVVAGAGGLWLWQRRRSRPPEAAAPPIHKTHPALAATLGETDDNYKAVSQALNTYLSAALQTPTYGLTRTELATRLRRQNLEPSFITRIQDCLARSEMGRYGPSPTDEASWALMADTETLLCDLDQIFGRRGK
jgi:hypothetical protein